MKRKSFSLMGFSFLVILQFLFLLNCQRNKPDKKLVQLWNSFTAAAEQRDEAKAKECLAKESQTYFQINPWRDYSKVKQTIIKVEKYGDYAKLHILNEENGKQTALFRYVVYENGKSLLQYPFLIFAKDWPTDTTEHFIIHYNLSPQYREGIFDSMLVGSDTLKVKIDEIEKFYSSIANLLGVTYPGKINYYLCLNFREVGELAGRKPYPRALLGKAIITSDKEELVEIAFLLGIQVEKPFYQLYSGLDLYASAEKTHQLTGEDPSELLYSRILPLYYKNKTSLIPEEFKMGYEELHSEASAREFMAATGLVVYYLATEFDKAKFRSLYHESHDYPSFEKALAKYYGLDINTLEQRIKQKMKKDMS
ncbi:MAG TPA: hypothetical protein VMT04_03630 [Terriglobales bacterium]|nr:hypothetical protein [Terriglobales bacterium]